MITSNFTFDPRESLERLAKEYNIQLNLECLEAILELPKELGEGSITSFSFSDGVDLLLFDCCFKSDWIILFDRHLIPSLQFNFTIKGGVQHFYNDRNIKYFLNPLQGTITADVPDSIHGFRFAQNQKITFASLTIDRKKYLKKIDCLVEKMPDKLKNLFSDVEARRAFFYQGNYSIASSECIQTILTDKHTDLVRSTYLEGITLELLASQIKQFRDDLAPPSQQVTFRKHDVERILQTKKILLDNMTEPPTIQDLSKLVGLNQTKLKRGFKKVFGKPIKTWLRDKRLETAKLLILQEDMSIRNVADAVGYSNQSHFSNRFREKYGVLPKNFAQSVKVRLADFK